MTDLGDISVGRTLSAARKKKRLRYKKLSSELNIDESYLVALEEDNFELIPGGEAYVKGFLRSYAKKLDLNPDEIIQIYSSAREKFSDKSSGDLSLQPKKDYINQTKYLLALVLVLKQVPANTLFDLYSLFLVEDLDLLNSYRKIFPLQKNKFE